MPLLSFMLWRGILPAEMGIAKAMVKKRHAPNRKSAVTHPTEFDLQSLRYFTLLMSELNVTRAAEQAGIGQSAMSHALRRLRKSFSDPLVVTSGRRLVPTKRALELADEVREILAKVSSFTAVSERFDPKTSEASFVMTATESFEFLWMPKIVAWMRNNAPGIRIESRAPTAGMEVKWLEQGDIDFRIGWVPDPIMTLRFQNLHYDKFVCVARRGHPGIGGNLSLRSFLDLPHARYRFALVMNRNVDNMVASQGERLNVVFLGQSYHIIAKIVARTDIIAIMPGETARQITQGLPLQTFPVPLDLPEIRFGIYWHERTHEDPAHKWFRRKVVELTRMPRARVPAR